MKANLHLHSCFSDGSSWPEEIALTARQLGLELVAVTDHDTMGGTRIFMEACETAGIQAVPACEIDINDPEIDYKSELLAYFPAITHASELAQLPAYDTKQDSAHGKAPDAGKIPATMAMLEKTLSERRKRFEYYLYWVRTIFRRDDLVLADALKEKLGERGLSDPSIPAWISWSKVDLFLYLKARGLIPIYMTYKAFKREWFVPGRFPKYKLPKPGIRQVAETVHRDGGFAVVPHIGHLWDDDIEAMEKDRKKVKRLLEFFKTANIDGIEMYWYSGKKKSDAINSFIRELAEPMGFFCTYGSDCHGPGTDKLTIDRFSGDFPGFRV